MIGGRRLARRGAGLVGILGTGAAGLGYLNYTDAYDGWLDAQVQENNLLRSLLFWKGVLPIYVAYEYHNWRYRAASADERARIFNALHDKFSPRVEALVHRLKGFYLKQAQFMSLRHDFLPPQYQSWCEGLQDMVPVKANIDDARNRIGTQLRLPERLAASLEVSLIGSASIGHVYKVRLPASARPLFDSHANIAVKLKHQNIETMFRSDLNTLLGFTKFAMPQFVKSLEELEKQYAYEFDYAQEALNLNTAKKNLLHVCYVPKAFADYCSRDMLVMELAPGQNLVSAVRAYYQRLLMMTFHNARSTIDPSIDKKTPLPKLSWLQFNFLYYQALLLNTWQAWFSRNSAGSHLDLVTYNLDIEDVINKIVYIFGHQVFVDGFFSCDGHPGNILVDLSRPVKNTHDLTLIDFGMCKRLTKQARRRFAKLIVALAEEDIDQACKILKDELKNTSKYSRADIAYRLAQLWFDREDNTVLSGMNIHQFLAYAEQEDPILTINEDCVLLARCVMILRGLGSAFGYNLSIARAWKPLALRCLDEEESD